MTRCWWPDGHAQDEIDRNTYSLFGLESGVPTDAYGLDDAIAEGYLAPPKRFRCR